MLPFKVMSLWTEIWDLDIVIVKIVGSFSHKVKADIMTCFFYPVVNIAHVASRTIKGGSRSLK